MNQRAILITGAIIGMLAVAIGAFGAHGLKTLLLQNQRADTFELAVRYQFYHTFALLFVGLAMNTYRDAKLRWSAWLFLIGILIFSGSLYALSLTGKTFVGAITPIGGLSFIGGWILLLLTFARPTAER